MKKTLQIVLIIFFVGVIIITATTAVLINNIMGINKELSFDKDRLLLVNANIAYYDSQNNLVDDAVSTKQIIKIEDVPQYVLDAFISIEDKSFYNHKGINYKRIVKAMMNNMRQGKFVEGASTISQQLIKNTYLSPEKTIKRKVKEILLTKKLEKEFTKKDILETYLNVIYFGESSYGIADASLNYFNKDITDLTLSESALLAGIIKSPGTYSPIYNQEKSIMRRNLVLKEMLRDEKISQGMYDEAITEPIILSTERREESPATLYYKACLKEASEILQLSAKDLALSGVKIYTHLDINKQNKLYEIINNDDYYEKNSYDNVADSLSIIINNKTAGVEAYAGRSPYNLTSFNRQPGSAIKPILVYAPALDNGSIHPISQILDEKVNIDGYSPNNVGGFHGYVSVEEAIASSLNVPAVKVLHEYGIENAKQFATRAGVNFHEKDTGLAVALGGFTNGITLKELTNTFSTFANNGQYKKASFVRKIVDSSGKVLYENNKSSHSIMGEDTAYLMTNLLIEGVRTGTSRRLKDLPYQVAGKTGTVVVPGKNDNSDAVSIAYTTEHIMGAWLGNYSNDEKHNLTSKNNGGTYVTQMIHDMFTEIYKDKQPSNFLQPTSVEEIRLDADALEKDHIIVRASDDMPDRYTQTELFASRYKPDKVSSNYEMLSVDNFDVYIKRDNSAEISFDAKRFFTYKILRQMGSQESVVSVIADVEGAQLVTDVNLSADTKYNYFIEISNSKNTKRSDYISVLTNSSNKKFEDILQQHISSNDSSWLFST